MGQLTNLYVSESYQGLLKLTDSSQGVTGTLQSVQDGVGNNLPIKISSTEVIITGSLIGTASYATQALSASWAPDTTNTGSLVTTSSFNAFTSSIDGRVDALEVETGSLQNQINQKLNTSSFNSYTSSNDSKVNSLINSTGSYATTSSLTTLSGSIATTDLGQDNRLSSLEINSGSQQLQINQKLDSSSFNSYTSSNDSRVNSLISQTGSYVTETESGSFMITGSVAGDTLTFTKGNGSQFSLQVNTGSLPSGVVSGSAQIVDLGFATTSSVNSLSSSIATTDLNQNNVIAGLATTSSLTSLSSSIASTDLGQNNRLGSLETATGSLQNQINQKLDSSSFNSYTSSNDSKVNSLISSTGSYATTSSLTSLSSSIASTDLSQNNRLTSLEGVTGSINRNGLITTGSVGGNQSITGSVDISGTLTATSASITYLETVYETASVIYSSGSNQFGDASDDTQTLWGTVNLPTGPLTITGSLHSTNIKGTGSLFLQPNQGDARFVEIYNTSPTDTHITASGGQIFLGDDQTYVKVDNYGSVERIDIVAGNELVISSSIVNLSGSLHQSGTFYPDVIDWFSSSIVQNTGSYVLTTDALGVTQYDSYQNVASALQPFINTGSLPSGLVSGSSQISYTGITDVPNGIVSGSSQVSFTGITDVPLGLVSGSSQIIGLGFATTGSVDALTGSINSLNSATSSYVTETESGSFVTNVAGGTVSFEDQIIVTKGNGSSSTITINNVTNADSASYATNALSASYAPSNPLPNGVVSGSQQIVDLGFATTSSVNQKLDTGSFNSYTASMDARTGSYITTGSAASSQSITGSLILSGSAGVELDVKGDQNNTGSVNISGSLNVVGPVGLNLLQPNPFKQNLTLLGGVNHFTSSTILNNYLNAITTSLSNNDTNFGLLPGGGLGGNIGNFTGSLFISGSNNLILSLGAQLPASQGRRGTIGLGNIILTNPTINTSSLTIPAINNNYNAGGVTLTLTTGSSLGNNAHSFAGNVNLGSVTWNHPSASIVNSQPSIISNNVNVGTITSITTGPTILTSSATLQNNIISNPTTNLNHISSSIQFNQNIVGGNTITLNNRYYTTGSNNFLASSANIFGGQQIVVNAAGAPSTNVSRTLVGNIIGGQTVNVSLEANNTDTGGLRNSIVYGQGLNVSGSHSAASTAVNSIALVGRWNGEDNGLADSARTVFAVGTGTATGTRRTGLYVTSGSLVGVSGSLDVKGPSVMSGSLNVTGNVLFASGSNTTMGTVALDGANPGTATVSNTLVTSNSLIFLTKQTYNHPQGQGVSISSKGTGTFTITSNHNGDADTVAYLIINPS